MEQVPISLACLDIGSCLLTLERWTSAVDRYYHDCLQALKRGPGAYKDDYRLFCFLSMVTLLKHPRGINIGSQPSAIGSLVFSDSRDDFLHGLLTRRLGTCASLPVLFASIGRRLGWPIHLAVSKRHVFCQWVNEDGSHLNLEGSCLGGGESFSDEHYRRWPAALTEDELASGHYLRPLTSAEERALFLEFRGHCLVDNGRYEEARAAYHEAYDAAPGWNLLPQHLYALERIEYARSACRNQERTIAMCYSPSLGRWIQQDPIGYSDGLNLYQGWRSSPVTATDPLGLMIGAVIRGQMVERLIQATDDQDWQTREDAQLALEEAVADNLVSRDYLEQQMGGESRSSETRKALDYLLKVAFPRATTAPFDGPDPLTPPPDPPPSRPR